MKYLIVLLLGVHLLADKPNLFLLNTYKEDLNVSGWYMSEKLDGVRAYWDGQRLVSRGGNVIDAPGFFTKGFPSHKLDGELWSKRGEFDNISSIVRSQARNQWESLTYNIFEVPEADGNLSERLSKVKETKYLKRLKQIEVKNTAHLKAFQKEVEEKGGEGVVVRDANLPYYTGRNNNALKLKSFLDDECIVNAHLSGDGKYKNKLGSIKCKLKSGKILKIGTGFSDAQREDPPKIGSVITFKYYGLTSKGNPRFPVFLRERGINALHK
jgi:DNA ligase-1